MKYVKVILYLGCLVGSYLLLGYKTYCGVILYNAAMQFIKDQRRYNENFRSIKTTN